MPPALRKDKTRAINRFIVDIIIIAASLMISTSYILPLSSSKYFLFIIVGLSATLFLFYRIPTRLRTDRKLKYSFYLLLLSSLIYSVFLRNNFANFLIFSSGVILLIYFYYYGLDRINLVLLYTCNVLLAIVHIIGSQNPDAFSVSSNALVSNYQNSNMTGIVITSSILILITGLYYVKTNYFKLLLILLIIACSYLLYQTNNRGSLLAIIVFLILLIFSWGKNKEFKLAKTIVLLFPALILLVISSFIKILPDDIMISNKPIFSGREREWVDIVGTMLSDPLNIYKMPIGGLNYIIVGIIEYGGIAIFLYVYILFLIRPNIIYYSGINYKHVAYLAFICVFIQQTFEATLITGSYGVYVNSYLLLGIACSYFDIDKAKNNQKK